MPKECTHPYPKFLFNTTLLDGSEASVNKCLICKKTLLIKKVDEAKTVET